MIFYLILGCFDIYNGVNIFWILNRVKNVVGYKVYIFLFFFWEIKYYLMEYNIFLSFFSFNCV